MTRLTVDVDHVKRINDTFGHMAGDAVIGQVVDVMKFTVCDDDMVCRFGGEEFVIFWSCAARHLAAMIAERACVDVPTQRLDWDGDAALRKTGSAGGLQMQAVDELKAA